MTPEIWRYIFDAIEDPVFLHDEQFRVQLANRAYCREAGMPEAEALGKPYWEVFPLGTGPMAGCKDTIDTKAHDRSQEEVHAGAKVFLSKGYTVRDDQGVVLYSLHVLTDITAQKRTYRTEAHYGRLFESAKDGILILNAESGLIVDANPFMTELLGFSRDEFLGKHLWELGFLKDIVASKDRFVELQQQEYLRYEDVVLETAQGNTTHVEFVSNAYLVDGIRVIQCNFRDNTRRSLAEVESLRLSHMYRTISRCNETLVRATDEMELNRAMCRVLTEEGGFRVAWVGYVEQGADKRIRPVASTGVEDGFFESLDLSWADEEHGQGSAATAARTGQAVVSHDVFADARSASEREQASQLKYSTIAAIPLKLDQHDLGVLVVYGAQPNEFTKDVMSLLTELANDLAFGIGNLRSRGERIDMLEKLEHSLDHAVTAIAATVEMRDPYTAGHQRRVALLATAIAAEMGLPTDQVQGLRMAALVHDIGKIRVPAEILSNPGRLSDPEFEIIRTHSRIGWDILKGIDFPWPVAEIVYQHHERLDGSGYPRGLNGNAILQEARILAVADVVEAMSSHRPYRPGHAVFEGLQEISTNKGKFYDVAAVEACLRLFMEKKYEL